MTDAIDLMLRHRSVRRFKPDPVPDDDLRRAVEAGQAASTSSAVQACCCLRVTDPDARRRIADLAGPQEKIVECGCFLVVCGDQRRHRLICKRAGRSLATNCESFLVAVIDAALFAQNAALAFESMGYGVCYIGGLRNDLRAVDEALSLPANVYPLFGMCVGVPDESPSKRPRLPIEAVLFDDRYPDDATMLASVDAYDARYAAYMADRGGAGGWSDKMIGKASAPTRTDVGDFYRSKGASTD